MLRGTAAGPRGKPHKHHPNSSSSRLRHHTPHLALSMERLKFKVQGRQIQRWDGCVQGSDVTASLQPLCGAGTSMETHPEDVPSLLEASLGDSVALTQGSFLSILGYCPRGSAVTGTCGTRSSATSSAPPAPLRLGTSSPSEVSLGNLQTHSNGHLGSVCYL